MVEDVPLIPERDNFEYTEEMYPLAMTTPFNTQYFSIGFDDEQNAADILSDGLTFNWTSADAAILSNLSAKIFFQQHQCKRSLRRHCGMHDRQPSAQQEQHDSERTHSTPRGFDPSQLDLDHPSTLARPPQRRFPRLDALVQLALPRSALEIRSPPVTFSWSTRLR